MINSTNNTIACPTWPCTHTHTHTHTQEEVLADVHSRLWALLRPLVLSRRARDVDLCCRRAAATSLNLFDHFSSVRGDS